MSHSPQLNSNCPLQWDYRLGLSGSGLIVYGALPASLTALGVLKPPDQTSLPLSAHSTLFIGVIAVAPVILTFVLTRQRMSAWYVAADYRNLRAVLVTLGIIVASTLVCLAARALTKPDIGSALGEWFHLGFAKELNTIGHALLLSLAFLVGSSTLFLTVIKEDSGLPLLPSKDRLKSETDLRQRLVETVAAAKDWPPGAVDGMPLADRTTDLTTKIAEAKAAIISLRRSAKRFGRSQLYSLLSDELDALARAIGEANNDHAAARAKYWTTPPVVALNNDETGWRTLVRRHAELAVIG